MSSNVQSIVCCLGDPVAGNPSQFLMQRAAASQSLDWMFVTAEVPEEKIIEAFQGIRALRFSGVAFLPPHQTAGCSLVDSVTEAALRSGHVRVARRDGNLWLGDDTLGAGIVELIKSHSEHNDAGVGDSSDPRVILVSGRPWLSHLIRLALPATWNNSLFELVQTPLPSKVSPTDSAVHNGDVRSNIDRMHEKESSASIHQISFDAALQLDRPIDTIIVDSTALCPTSKTFAKLNWTTNPTLVFVEPNARWESSIAAMNIPHARIFRAIDVAAAKAVVNFNFWTGHHTELGFVRESLDEYCQW